MPIENERKYVLEDSDHLGFKTSLLALPISKELKIRQGYLDSANRIREIVHTDGKPTEYLFTYKTKINGHQIEIENNISERDFTSLWTVVTNIITKSRVCVPHDAYTWEVDFLYSNKKKSIGDCYLVMAEVELPEADELPKVVPSFISENLVYLVPKNDRRFINRNLSRPNAVKAMVKDIKEALNVK